MVVFETHHAKTYSLGSGVAPQTRIPLHTMGPKRYSWIPKIVVFETHTAKTYSLGSGLVARTRIPLHTMGAKRCFWMPKMVIEMHHAKKEAVGFVVAP